MKKLLFLSFCFFTSFISAEVPWQASAHQDFMKETMIEVLRSEKNASTQDIVSMITERFIATLDVEKVEQLLAINNMGSEHLYKGTIFAWSNPVQIRVIIDYIKAIYLDTLKKFENKREQKNYLLDLVRKDNNLSKEVKRQVLYALKSVLLSSPSITGSLESLITRLESLAIAREQQLLETGKYDQFENFIYEKIKKEKMAVLCNK